MDDRYSRLLGQLVDGTLDPTDFSHRDHLGVAAAALRQYQFFPALALIADGLESLAIRAGCPGKFNATITLACMSRVAERLALSGNQPLDAILDDCIEPTGQASLLALYGSERLTGRLARQIPLLPERRQE